MCRTLSIELHTQCSCTLSCQHFLYTLHASTCPQYTRHIQRVHLSLFLENFAQDFCYEILPKHHMVHRLSLFFLQYRCQKRWAYGFIIEIPTGVAYHAPVSIREQAGSSLLKCIDTPHSIHTILFIFFSLMASPDQCALDASGNLKDAADIVFYGSESDEVPLPGPSDKIRMYPTPVSWIHS